jgi:hypothetical protein
MQNAEFLPSTFSIHPFPLVRPVRSTVGTGNLPFRDPANAGRRFLPPRRFERHGLARRKMH